MFSSLMIMGLALSLNAYSQVSGYAPNNGTAQPGNPGTFTAPGSGLGNADSNTEANKNLERSNTSPNPIPTDTTLQNGKIQTGPYKTPGNKQSQESKEEEFDYRSLERVNHDEESLPGNQ